MSHSSVLKNVDRTFPDHPHYFTPWFAIESDTLAHGFNGAAKQITGRAGIEDDHGCSPCAIPTIEWATGNERDVERLEEIRRDILGANTWSIRRVLTPRVHGDRRTRVQGPGCAGRNRTHVAQSA